MRKSTIWLIIVLLLAAFLRLWDLKNIPPGLWADEAVNGVNTLQAIRSFDISTFRVGWKVFYPENFGREGLFINIQSLFVWALGTEPWVLRLPSAMIGILTVLGLYLMVLELFRNQNPKSAARNPKQTTNHNDQNSKQFGILNFRNCKLFGNWKLEIGNSGGQRIALIAAFFLATNFWHINFSRIGFRAIMAPLFLVWSFYFLFLGIKKTETPSTPGVKIPKTPGVFSVAVFTIAGLLFGAGFHTYIAYRIAPIVALYPLWIFYKNWRQKVITQLGRPTSKLNYCAPCLIVLFILMAIVAASPLLMYYAQNHADFFGRTSGISIFQSVNPFSKFAENFIKTFQMFFLFGDFNWRHNFAGSPQLWWPVSLLFLLGIWKALRSSTLGVKSQKTPSVFPRNAVNFILLWFAIMLLPVAISNEGLPHALRAIALIPPAIIFAALGLEFIIEKIKHQLSLAVKPPSGRFKKELAILLSTFFFATAAHAYNTYFNRWAPNLNVYNSFQADLTEKAHWLKEQSYDIKKYVITGEVDKIDLTGSPMSLQPIIFITDTFYEAKQRAKNIYYVALNDLESVLCENHCIIVPTESNPKTLHSVKQKIQGLKIDGSPGFVTFKK